MLPVKRNLRHFGAPFGAPKLGWCTFTDSNRGPTD